MLEQNFIYDVEFQTRVGDWNALKYIIPDETNLKIFIGSKQIDIN